MRHGHSSPSAEARSKRFAQAVPSPSLRERKHEVVREALSAAAEELFLKRGYERTTVEQIARAAGVSRRTFFRYYESKEDVLVDRSDHVGERLLAAIAARPLGEPPLLTIRNALVPAIEAGIEDRAFIRWAIRALRETSALRRAMMERRNRLEERIAGLIASRLHADPDDDTPMLLAFVTRALHDTAFNAWYDHETDDVAGLVDDLLGRLRTLVLAVPAPRHRVARAAQVSPRDPRRARDAQAGGAPAPTRPGVRKARAAPSKAR